MEYFWFWYGDDGEWTAFEDSVMVQLEQARQAKAVSVTVQLGPNMYELNLEKEEQINLRTGYLRPIKKTVALWWWRGDDGISWNRYSREDSLRIALAEESALETGAYFQRGNKLYYVDLIHRVQKNMLTMFERPIFKGFPPGVRPALQLQQQQQQQEEEEEEDTSSTPRSFCCPLSQQLMVDPVATTEGITYERRNIVEYLKTHNEDPVTRRLLRDKSLRENRALRDTIEAWLHVQEQEETEPAFSSNDDSDEKPAAIAISPYTSAGGSAATATNTSSNSEVPERNLILPQHEMLFTEDYARSETILDTIKVVCLGLSNVGSDVAFRNPTNKNIYEWDLQITHPSPTTAATTKVQGIHCHVYDFVGQNIHHASQKLFFSPKQALYVVVWDMAPKIPNHDMTALDRDMYENVQYWIDAIQKHAPGATILPVVSKDGSFGAATQRRASRTTTKKDSSSQQKNGTSSSSLDKHDIRNRCLQLRDYLEEVNNEKESSQQVNLIFGRDNDDPVLKLSASDDLKSLKRRILQVINEGSTYEQLGSPISKAYQNVQNAIKSRKLEGEKISTVEALVAHCDTTILDTELRSALEYLSSTGEILYYGSESGRNGDTPLNRYVILDPRWLADAITSILRPDADKAIRKAKKKKRMLPEGSATVPKLDDVDHVSHPGPVITEDDAHLLWGEAFSKESDEKKIDSSALSQLFDFLQLLFTRFGVMVPLDATNFDDLALADMTEVFSRKNDSPILIDIPGDSRLLFLPGLLAPGEHGKSLGLYQNAVFSKTTLAQSVQFYSVISPLLLERICAASLRQIYAAAEESRPGKEPMEGQMYVKDVLCWRTLLYFKLGLYIRNSDGELQGSVVDIFAHLVDHNNELCVGSKFMGDAKQCLVISAKGEEGNDGSVIWQGGYDLITEAVRQLLESSTSIDYDRQVFCPTCLARRDLRDTRSWSECVIQRALEDGEQELKCQDGHREKTRLLLGLSEKCDDTEKLFPSPSDVPSDNLMRGVVMVGLYDESQTSNKIRKLGSGFVVDSERGLIVTAGHTLMKIWGKEDFGTEYDGIAGAKVVIGIIPAKKKKTDSFYPPAVFRYFATILEKDPSLNDGECHVDACVLQITSRFENDVNGNGDACSEEISMRLHGNSLLLKEQELMSLDITTESHLGEPTRILGFDQPDTNRLNRSFGVSAGYVCKQFETKTVGGERYRYMPRKKTVLICPTIGGHSGGPCVNQLGQVIGILSCADPTEKSRCYLVPTSEWLHLLPKKLCGSALKEDSSISKRAVNLVKNKPPNKSSP